MPRPIAIDDFMNLRLVSDPQITPGGERVACVVKRIEREKNKYLSQIWVVPTNPEQAGGEARPFTGEDSSAFHPRWSPDGKQLAFLSDRQKPKSQIYLLPSDGGEARALTHLETEGGIGGFRWSPDGTKIAFTFRATPAAFRKDAAEERKKKELSSPVRHHSRLFYRLDGMGYFDDEYFQVWLADAKTGEARQLTTGPYHCDLPTWSPDSRTLAFLSDRREDGDIAPAQDDIWTIAAQDVFAAEEGANAGITARRRSRTNRNRQGRSRNRRKTAWSIRWFLFRRRRGQKVRWRGRRMENRSRMSACPTRWIHGTPPMSAFIFCLQVGVRQRGT